MDPHAHGQDPEPGESSAAEHARGAARAVGTVALETVALTRLGWRATRRFVRSHGAGETGLAKLIDLTALGSAGDAIVTVSLAGTLFFSVPTGQARGRVAIYLLVTMAPFAVLAPVVGPALDRLGHGRRFAMAGTFALRALLALVMAGAVAGVEDPLRLYPAAFGVLVAVKAYGVARAAAMPRLLPRGLDLVTANARVSLASLVALSVMGPVGAGVVHLLGAPWALRLACAVFVIGTVLAVRLPRRLDDERAARGAASPGDTYAASVPPQAPRVEPDEPSFASSPDSGGRWFGRARLRAARAAHAEALGPSVVRALRSNAAIRAFGGFLLLHLAFLLRAEPLHGLPATGLIAAAAAAAGLGSAAGASLGAALRARPPEGTVLVSLLVVTVAAALAWLLYGLVAVLAVAVVAGLTQTLGKLALDALVQRDVPAPVRASAFARTETLLQLSWVAGAGAGTLLPPHRGLGLGLAALVLAAAAVGALLANRARKGGYAGDPARGSAHDASPRGAGTGYGR